MRVQVHVAPVLVLLASIAPALAAQNPDPAGPLRSAVSATPPLNRVRVELAGGRQLTGTLLEAEAGSLILADATGARTRVPYAGVTRYWERRRATRTGAIVGGIAGAAFGALFGMAMVGTCSVDCTNTSVTEGAVYGGLIIGVAGVGAGAAIGAALPRWSLRWTANGPTQPAAAAMPTEAAPEPLAAAATPPKARQIGELTLMALAGYGGSDPSPGSGTAGTQGALAGASVGLALRWRRLGFGFEIGAMTADQDVSFSRWIARYDLKDASRGGLVPYAIAGLGSMNWGSGDSTSALTAGVLGAGVTFGDHHRWRAEVQWNPVLEDLDPTYPSPTLVTVGAGRRFSW